MGDVMILFLINNVLIFSIIFWLLTWGSEYFFTKKSQLTKKQFYECGFKAISELNIQVNYNFFMLSVFLVLYDIEFTFLYPILFNFNNINFIEFFIFIFFIFFIIISLYYDWLNNTLSWTIE
uniref:NADH-ubiquinone oxidoreductase chain 3 n=1 Tax=Ichthyophthirius multifiliis TaxID=5932 RepID=G1FLD1_ICHMU|nr:NADH dehydrogenase subunit 3 [Ichthyophthirius multifiliis]AEL89273.1 NADH dehydrogenase subunit 3 [Ichthyophthirius multifiliis]